MTTKKVRFKISRGNPSTGAIIRAGAVIELAEFWADKFIADGTAELIEETEKTKSKKKGKKNES